MALWKIYHNPKCSKSRQTLALLQEKGIEPQVIEYLKTPLTQKELQDLGQKLDRPLSQFVREKEQVFQELKLKDASAGELLKAVVENPVLLERPIVVKGNRAVIGRPPENVLELFSARRI